MCARGSRIVGEERLGVKGIQKRKACQLELVAMGQKRIVMSEEELRKESNQGKEDVMYVCCNKYRCSNSEWTRSPRSLQEWMREGL